MNYVAVGTILRTHVRWKKKSRIPNFRFNYPQLLPLSLMIMCLSKGAPRYKHKCIPYTVSASKLNKATELGFLLTQEFFKKSLKYFKIIISTQISSKAVLTYIACLK